MTWKTPDSRLVDYLVGRYGTTGAFGKALAAQFTAYLTWLRADQKRKRNLVKLLDQRGLRTPAG
jgi:hypothetical protein